MKKKFLHIKQIRQDEISIFTQQLTNFLKAIRIRSSFGNDDQFNLMKIFPFSIVIFIFIQHTNDSPPKKLAKSFSKWKYKYISKRQVYQI